MRMMEGERKGGEGGKMWYSLIVLSCNILRFDCIIGSSREIASALSIPSPIHPGLPRTK